MSDGAPVYKIFSVYGIEIEYMIVDKQSLTPLPIADKVLANLNKGDITNEVELEDIAVSNELALHVIELKTNGPANDLNNLDKSFVKVLHLIQEVLNNFNAKLLPTGMHPFFVPDSSLKLWPYSNNEIYSTYNKIFNCQGHGWGNLQSTHINLPFSNEEEFYLLHESIRLILPIIPALTASTPFVSGNATDCADNRLLYYGKNQSSIPCISGQIIPESITTYQQYSEQILQPMYAAIAPYDKQGILQYEWLNSRGAITRFERNAIEIRILDSQESPLMDLICVMLVAYGLRDFITTKIHNQKPEVSLDSLVEIYKNCIKHGSKAIISNKDYLNLLNYPIHKNQIPTAKQIWEYIFNNIKSSIPSEYHPAINIYLSQGTLSERLLKSYQDKHSLDDIYKQLHTCLIENLAFNNE